MEFFFLYRFDSKMPFSLMIVFISPSKNRLNGWMKQFSAAVVKSRSVWPSFCSVWPTLSNALPYAPSWPNSAPAWCRKREKRILLLILGNVLNWNVFTHLNHIQTQILQITEPHRFLFLDFFKYKVFGPIAWIRCKYGFCIAYNFFGPCFCTFGTFG